MSTPRFSVVIPLYNKGREIEHTLRAILAQQTLPEEIIVVDDGSQDDGADVVRGIASPLIHLVRQENRGVSAARNRGIALAKGDYIALADGDDVWTEDHLTHLADLIRDYPDAGLYCTAFQIRTHDTLTPAPCPTERGLVANFFRDSAHRYIAIPSTACIPKRVFDAVGMFPEGMKIGEDLHLWIRIARKYRVAFDPRPSVCYSRTAENRSSAIYRPEPEDHRFEELYDPTASDEDREFVARAALGRALLLSIKGATCEAQSTAEFFGYTRTYRSTLRKILVLNRLPASWRAPLMAFYNRMAWLIARKGL